MSEVERNRLESSNFLVPKSFIWAMSYYESLLKLM